MAEPFLGEVKLFGFGRIPRGWAPCDGSLLQIRYFQALFSLIGTTYGGDGKTTFGVPDLRGRVAIGASSTSPSDPTHLGAASGQEGVVLVANNIPAHNHHFMVSVNAGNATGVADAVYASPQTPSPENLYGPPSTPMVTIGANSLQSAGGSAPHQNMQPYTVLTYCIAVQGVYPTRP
ncbi:phage tail protein [Phaeospirillum tilakii]|uniref:Phage tail protein n=1 Tax=Phaeospirillum tilakii TaxID=741673 RepID=A0ABW5CAL1_9PROT